MIDNGRARHRNDIAANIEPCSAAEHIDKHLE